VTSDGTGTATDVVAIVTCRMGVTNASADTPAIGVGAGSLEAAALALASVRQSVRQLEVEWELTFDGAGVNGELNGLGRGFRSQVVDTGLETPLPAIEVHGRELREGWVGQVNV
jgi:hypothetical protein